jgi:hypothetical protein
MTGVSIGLVTRQVYSRIRRHLSDPFPSVKMVGLFVTALVGLYTIEDLWEKFGDLKMPVVSSLPANCSEYCLKPPNIA